MPSCPLAIGTQCQGARRHSDWGIRLSSPCHCEGTSSLSELWESASIQTCHCKGLKTPWQSHLGIGIATMLSFLNQFGTVSCLGLSATQTPSFHFVKSKILLSFHRSFCEDSAPSLRSVGFAEIRWIPTRPGGRSE